MRATYIGQAIPSTNGRCIQHPIFRSAAPSRRFVSRPSQFRPFTVLAIETSCDDTSVAILDARRSQGTEGQKYNVLFHERVTANNDAYTGIHPTVALESHRANLALLIRKALLKTFHVETPQEKRSTRGLTPDLVAVTRGPGMRSNLAVGLDTAKGLAVAWNVPLVGVNHMQAHALTPRLVDAVNDDGKDSRTPEPRFPFLSVLASGGHTLLLDSRDLNDHAVLAETQDIALGDCLDKAARAILPSALLKSPFGRALEHFAFHTRLDELSNTESPRHAGVSAPRQAPKSGPFETVETVINFKYKTPATRGEELARRRTQWGWSLAPPLAESKGGEKSSRRMVFSFAGLLSSVERFMRYKAGSDGSLTDEARQPGDISLEERQTMAQEVQRVVFEHLASRIMLYLTSHPDWRGDTVVLSGGVASNQFLRHVLRSILDVRGYKHIKLAFPPIELCTDNALMIAWAGLEMHRAGYISTLDIGPIRKWSLDPNAPDGGILGVGGWENITPEHTTECSDG